MTDDERLPDPLAAVRALPRGSMVVVRARSGLEELSCAVLKIARERGLTVLIAGDPLLAMRLGADGIHLSEARAREAAHWRARFPKLTITSSAHSLRALMLARGEAVFLSPVFPTESHPGRAALTPPRANLMAGQARLPVFALGGVDSRNFGRLAKKNFAGVAGVATFKIRETLK